MREERELEKLVEPSDGRGPSADVQRHERSRAVRVYRADSASGANVRELFAFRFLIKNLVSRELKVRYKRSALGFVWTMLSPLLMMVVYTIVFTRIMRFDNMGNYAVYLLAGILPWNAFAQTVSQALPSVIHAEGLIRKIRMPKAVFPLAVVGSNTVNFTLSFIPLFVVMLVVGQPITWHVLLVPLGMVILIVTATGMALFFASLAVFFRDMMHLNEIFFMVWFFLSPVIYPLHALPEHYREYWKLNPMTHTIELFHDLIYNGTMPSLLAWGASIGFALLIFFFGWWFFHWNDKRYIHYL